MSSSIGSITLVFVALLVLKATSREVGANPAPAVDSVSSIKYPAHHSVEPKLELESSQLQQQQQTHLAPGQSDAPTSKQQPPQMSLAAKPSREVSGEKLRRGLSNFLNHLNPAQFFVPAAPVQPGAKKPNPAAAGSQAEPAAIINVDGPTANALIKGPSRLAAPLRWGRK